MNTLKFYFFVIITVLTIVKSVKAQEVLTFSEIEGNYFANVGSNVEYYKLMQTSTGFVIEYCKSEYRNEICNFVDYITEIKSNPLYPNFYYFQLEEDSLNTQDFTLKKINNYTLQLIIMRYNSVNNDWDIITFDKY